MMKRFTATLLALMLVLSMIGTALADEKPSTWLSDELVEITVMRSENASQPIKNDAPKYQAIEELLNVRLVVEAAPASNYDDKKSVLIATDDMPDIMFVSQSDVKKWASEEMFVNLSDYEDQMPNFFARMNSDARYSMLKVDGSYYYAPVLQRIDPENPADPSGALVNIRTDLLEKYNIPTPTTYDELFDAIVTIQQNEPDLIGITNRKGTSKLLSCMAYPLGSGSDMYYDADLGGKWIYGPAHENFKEVLTYLHKCYEAGVLDPDYATNTKDMWAEKLSSGRAICTVDNNGVVGNYNVALQTVDPSYQLAVIPSLTNSLGQTRNFSYDTDWLSQAWVISASSKNIDVCVKFLDWCYSDQGADVNGFGKEGVTFDYVDGKPVIKEEILAQYASGSNASYDVQSALGVGLNDVTPYVDTGCQMQMEVYQTGGRQSISDPNLRIPSVTPPLSAEAQERYNELAVKVSDMFNQEVDKYIIGTESIDNYDQLIEKLRAAGAEEMEQIYNDAWNAALGN